MLSLLRKVTGGEEEGGGGGERNGATASSAAVVPPLALDRLHARTPQAAAAAAAEGEEEEEEEEAAAGPQLVGGIHASLKVTGPGQPLMIEKVWPGGPAARSKMVSVGDLLIEVDGVDVTGKTVKEAQVCALPAPARPPTCLGACMLPVRSRA